MSNLSVNVLKKLIKLQSKKETLETQLATVDGQIESLMGGGGVFAESPAAVRKPARKKAASKKAAVKTAAKKAATKKASAKKASAKKASAKKTGRKRGNTGHKIVNALKDAGSEGMTVKELSSKLNLKTQNLYVWFNSTGKKMDEIQKVGKAKYAYKG